MSAVAAPARIPTSRAVRDLLGMLLVRDVEVRIGEPYAGDDGATTYAVYVDDLLRTRVVVVADLAFSALAGAAIGLVPLELAHRAVDRGTLPPMLADNLREVLNVCGATLNGAGLPHVRLHEVYPLGRGVPADVVAFAAVPGRRLDLDVEIPGYGGGRLSFVGLA